MRTDRSQIWKRCLLVAAMAALSPVRSGVCQPVRLPAGTAIANAVSRVQDAVVQIQTIGGLSEVEGVRVADHPRTGIVVDSEGYVLTASFNVAHQPTSIFVLLPNGTRYPAQVVAANHARQVTMLKIESGQPLNAVSGIPRSSLAVGQAVVGVGRSTRDGKIHLSSGIISALNRIRDKAIQTDAGVSPQNYGGPLVDIQGNVAGILVPLAPNGDSVVSGIDWYDSGIGFAVPLTELRINEMKQGKDLKEGILGVSFQEDRGYASTPVVLASPGNSPASVAGIQSGDRITRINGNPVRYVNEVRHALGSLYAGDSVTVEFERQGEVESREVQLASEITPWQHNMIGVAVRSDGESIRVTGVVPESPAQQAGLLLGDKLIALGPKAIREMADLENAIIGTTTGEQLTIQYQRNEAVSEVRFAVTSLNAIPVKDLEDPAATPGEIVELRLPESASQCRAYVPVTDAECGLLLWLPEPGEVDFEAVIQDWRDVCDRTGTALVVMQSGDAGQWNRNEIEFADKFVGQLQEKVAIDPWRLAVGGRKSGGTMASLIAMDRRDVWSGLVLVDAIPAQSTRLFVAEPAYRQMVFMCQSTMNNQARQMLQPVCDSFQKRNIPCYLMEKGTPDWQQQVMNWIVALARF